MAIDVMLVKEGTKLAAADPISYEALQSIKQKQVLVASIRRPRNAKHLRKWWALLGIIFEHQKTFATVQDLNNALKIATGLFDTGKTVDGMPWVQAKSISYAAMDQTRFEQFYDKAVDAILTRIVPGINREDLEVRVHEILDGYAR